MVALVVGIAAFLAGLQFAGNQHPNPTGPPAQSAAIVAPSGSPSPAAVLPTATPTSTEPTGVRTPSDFAIAFRPDRIIAGVRGGSTCETGSKQSFSPIGAESGPVVVAAWLTTCRIAKNQRFPLVDQLTQAMLRDVPVAMSTVSEDDGGSGLSYLSYATGAYEGTVMMTTDASGSSLLIATTLEEWQVR